MASYNALCLRNWRLNHRQLGLCGDCSGKATNGIYCRKCGDKHKIWRSKYRANHKLTRLCSNCGNPAVNSQTLCLIHRIKHNEGERARREIYMNENKCYTCGAPLIKEESKQCFSCKIQMNCWIPQGVLKYETAN